MRGDDPVSRFADRLPLVSSRMRGDDPNTQLRKPCCLGSSRMRGMIRVYRRVARSLCRVPRMRGDDPYSVTRETTGAASSPHARG